MFLTIVNSVLILIIIIVIAINTYYLFQTRQELAFTRLELSDIDLSKLVEFREVDPFLMNIYSHYISHGILPKLVQKFNQTITANPEYQQVVSNPAELYAFLDVLIAQIEAQISALDLNAILGIALATETTP
jgi:hypothetical protein